VHSGDLNGVVADHSEDIVMFDVPPPENRLRLTLGLRKEEGRWVVADEHHSFPLRSVV
jgi:ketosteroid isomerase-like protein